jgi:hypothetical protein
MAAFNGGNDGHDQHPLMNLVLRRHPARGAMRFAYCTLRFGKDIAPDQAVLTVNGMSVADLSLRSQKNPILLQGWGCRALPEGALPVTGTAYWILAFFFSSCW